METNLAQRFRLTVAYDGRPFEGWQSQPSGNTVQDQLLVSLQSICPEIATVQGSGRTDAGVSAAGQVAHFDAPPGWRMDHSDWQNALNAKLPRTIRVMACAPESADFHAQFSAKGKIYRYRIFTGPVLPPLDYGLTWHKRNLQAESFLEAIQVFIGTHHFRAFSANRNDGKDETRDTERTIFSIEHRLLTDESFEVDIHGNGFLYKMVRFLIGSAFYLADGKISKTDVQKWLAEPDCEKKAPYCAPPDGLLLKEVCYH